MCHCSRAPGFRSAARNTACTPGAASASSVSTAPIRARAKGLRTKQAWSIPGRETSSTKVPAPVSSRASSRRWTRAPEYLAAATGMPAASCLGSTACCLTSASLAGGRSAREQVRHMRTVVVGASSGLGRSIAIGLTQRGARVAMLARRRERLDAAVRRGRRRGAGDRVRRDRRGVVPVGDRRRGDPARRHRRAPLRTRDRPAGPSRRHRHRDLAAGVRHERHRRGAHHRRGGPLPHRIGRHGRLPVVRRARRSRHPGRGSARTS